MQFARRIYNFIVNAPSSVWSKYIANTRSLWNAMYRRGYDGKLNSPYQRARHYILCGLAADRLTPSTSILDIGCGCGTTYQLLSQLGVFYHGIDIAPEAIELAKASYGDHPHAVFEVADAQTFQATQLYDIIFFNEVLYYLPITGVEKLLMKASTMLKKPEGIIVISMSEQLKAKRVWQFCDRLGMPLQNIYLRAGIMGKWRVKVFPPFEAQQQGYHTLPEKAQVVPA